MNLNLKELDQRESFLQSNLEKGARLIKQAYGIELGWGEKAALKHYLNSILKQQEKGHNDSCGIQGDALTLFMRDFFGLDINELDGKVLFYDSSGRKRSVKTGLGLVNKGWYTSDPRFREYCQRKVQQWREERDYI